MASLTYLGKTRTLDIKGTITYRTGKQVSISKSDISSYKLSESTGGEGLALGSTEASSFTLELSNTDRAYSGKELDNAEVHMFLGIVGDDGATTWSDFGVWYVHTVTASEQSTSVTLQGYDALGSLFDSYYAETTTLYPTTIGSIVNTLCVVAGIKLKSTSFANAAMTLKTRPKWGENVTIRTVLGYCAACAGGFARITRNGLLEIVSYTDGEKYLIDCGSYTKFTLSNGEDFTFNCLEVKYVKEDDEDSDEVEDYTRYALDSSISDNATNTIQIENNPAMNETIVKSLVNEFKGLTASGIEVSWIGDPAVLIGDRLTILDKLGDTHVALVNSQTISFDGGLSANTYCKLPTLNSTSSTSYSTSGNLMDGNGNIRAIRISGLDQSVITATTAHFENLSATSASADKLLATILQAVNLTSDTIEGKTIKGSTITADKIGAGEITADKLDADTVDARVAELAKAEIESADIDWASITNLVSAMAQIAVANITTANINKAEIDWANVMGLTAEMAVVAEEIVEKSTITTAQIQDLQARVAEIVHLTVSTGEFTLADIQNLLANALILEQGNADSMLITNLSVTSANLLNATISELVLKGTDGKYYSVHVGADGSITTEQVTVTDGEISAGETSDGRQIVATNANVESLNASTVKASQAILSTIFTDSLTAGKITAGEMLTASASIDVLYTDAIEAIGNSLTFSANEKIQSIVGTLDEKVNVDTVDEIASNVESAFAMAEELENSVTDVQAAVKAAQESANTNATNIKNMQTTVTQTASGLSVVQTKQTDLEGRVETIESGVHIEGSEIGIYASDSPFKNTITNTGWEISENDAPIIICAETKLSSPRVQVTDALMIGGLAIRPGADKHVRVLKYGK